MRPGVGGGVDERRDERDQLREAFEVAGRGHAVVLSVSGPAGSGKSWLLDRFAGTVTGTAAGRAEADLLRIAGHPAEVELPFSGLHQLLGAAAQEELAALPRPQRNALAGALALDVDEMPPGDRFAVAVAVLGVLTRRAEQRTVVVLVDDLQWIDESSTQALVFAARRMTAVRVLMVFAARTGDGPDLPARSTVELAALRPYEARRLLLRQHPDLSAIVAQEIMDRACGLPLALIEIAGGLSSKQRRAEERLPAILPIGDRLERLYLDRISDLDERARRALITASIDEFDASSLDAALCAIGCTPDDLHAAELLGLIRVADRRVSFSHPIVRAAARLAATAAETRLAHAAAEQAFHDDVARRAWHLDALSSGPDAVTGDALAAAARAAAARSAYAEAGRAWERAVDHLGDPDGVRQARIQAAGCYLRCGARAPAFRLIDQLIGTSRSSAEVARWRTERLVVSMWASADGLPVDDRTELLGYVDKLAVDDPDLAVKLGALLSLADVVDGRYADARDALARTPEPPTGGDVTVALTRDLVMTAVGAVASPASASLLLSDWAGTLTDAQLCDPALPVSNLALMLDFLDRTDDAEALLRRQWDAINRTGSLSSAAISRGVMARISERRGAWARSASQYTEAETLSVDTDFVAPLPHIRIRHAYLLAAMGDDEGCRALVAAARGAVPGNRNVQHLAACVLGLLHLTRGRAVEAARHLAEATEIERLIGIGEPSYSSRMCDRFETLCVCDEPRRFWTTWMPMRIWPPERSGPARWPRRDAAAASLPTTPPSTRSSPPRCSSTPQRRTPSRLREHCSAGASGCVAPDARPTPGGRCVRLWTRSSGWAPDRGPTSSGPNWRPAASGASGRARLTSWPT